MRLDRCLIVSLLLPTLLLAACQTPQPAPGRSSGRVSPTTTTSAEARSPQVLPASLLEFSDQAAREIVRGLSDRSIYGVSDSEVLVTIVFGDIENNTQIVPSTDFEMARSQIRFNLLQSDMVKKSIRFVENRQRMEQIRSREWGDEPGLTVRRYDPEHTYLLNGTMYRVARGGSSLYAMNFELTHFTTGEIVFQDNFLEKR